MMEPEFDFPDDVDEVAAPVPGEFELHALVTEKSSLFSVGLPYAKQGDNREQAKAAKKARESLRKLMSGMNNDAEVLYFRAPFTDDACTKEDRYYKYAPGWTTCGWGKAPQLTMAPAKAARILIEAAACVPYVKKTTLFFKDASGIKKEISLAELEQKALPVRPIRNVYQAPQPASSNAGGSAAHHESQGLKTELRAKNELVTSLEEQVVILKSRLEELERGAKRPRQAKP